ncbi:hypothetical protein KCP70_17900 [Salmonella enterica subsp. enterica]|nr:hypothetical protein KCP70_17900 [Salmonella enterica subsp. enterica]
MKRPSRSSEEWVVPDCRFWIVMMKSVCQYAGYRNNRDSKVQLNEQKLDEAMITPHRHRAAKVDPAFTEISFAGRSR